MIVYGALSDRIHSADKCSIFFNLRMSVAGRCLAVIRSENLVYEYRRNSTGDEKISMRVLDGLSIDIKDGQFISIVGHNGSGKSTFARHLNALLVPTEGTLWVNGLDTSDDKNTLGIRQQTGMVFQNPDNQIVANVVEEDVAFALENTGVPTGKIWQRVEKSLATVGMLRYRNEPPNHLSGGQKQRLAIAGILAMKPRCIVLDEATAMLDPGGRKEVIEAVRGLNKEEHINIILITHYMEETIYSDRIFVMNKGKIVMDDTPEQIFSDISVLERYNLEAPPAIYMADRLKRAGLDLKGPVLCMQDLAAALADIFKKEQAVPGKKQSVPGNETGRAGK